MYLGSLDSHSIHTCGSLTSLFRPNLKSRLQPAALGFLLQTPMHVAPEEFVGPPSRHDTDTDTAIRQREEHLLGAEQLKYIYI